MTDFAPKVAKEDRFLAFKEKPTWGDVLTIGIAASCEVNTDSPRIIFCADRLITGNIKFEHGVPKIKRLQDNCFVMIATNDGLMSDMIIEEVKKQIANKKLPVGEIAKLFGKECKHFQHEEIEREVLSEYGLSFEILSNNIKNYSPELLDFISTQIKTYKTYRYKFKVQFLVLGIDDFILPHIYVIDEEGEYRSMDFIGFACIGSGATLAHSEMSKYLYYPNVNYIQVLYRMYTAKKIAERNEGVGQATDLVMLYVATNEKTKIKTYELWIPSEIQEVVDVLEKGLKKVHDSELDTYGEVGEGINEYIDKAFGTSSGKKQEVKKD